MVELTRAIKPSDFGMDSGPSFGLGPSGYVTGAVKPSDFGMDSGPSSGLGPSGYAQSDSLPGTASPMIDSGPSGYTSMSESPSGPTLSPGGGSTAHDSPMKITPDSPGFNSQLGDTSPVGSSFSEMNKGLLDFGPSGYESPVSDLIRPVSPKDFSGLNSSSSSLPVETPLDSQLKLDSQFKEVQSCLDQFKPDKSMEIPKFDPVTDLGLTGTASSGPSFDHKKFLGQLNLPKPVETPKLDLSLPGSMGPTPKTKEVQTHFEHTSAAHMGHQDFFHEDVHTHLAGPDRSLLVKKIAEKNHVPVSVPDGQTKLDHFDLIQKLGIPNKFSNR